MLDKTTLTTDFWWATGIEDTFIPQGRPGLRPLDEYELTQHYRMWKEDFALAAGLGVRYLRWGLPWYRIQPAPDRWDWAWADEALDALVNHAGVTPILDLMHYGTPLWLDNSFINASYPDLVAEYAGRVAERYRSLVHIYTPLNEPSVNAEFCGARSLWPPYLSGEDGYVKVLLSLAKGIIATTRALQDAQPRLVTVQVEALWQHWTNDPSPEFRAFVEANNQRRYLPFDLCTGRVDENHPSYAMLRKNEVSQGELEWLRANAVSFDIFGANFYPWSYGEVTPPRAAARPGETMRHQPGDVHGGKLAEILADAARHTRLPVMVTETSARRDIPGRLRWMDETLQAVRQLRLEGVPVIGYTWFPMFTMIDWEYRTGRRPLEHYLLDLGLYDSRFNPEGDLLRHPTPLVERYRQHIQQGMPPLPNAA